MSDYDALLNENVPYQTGSVQNLHLAKFGCAVYLFFDFVKFMLWFFLGISLASLCAVYFNYKGTLRSPQTPASRSTGAGLSSRRRATETSSTPTVAPRTARCKTATWRCS